MNHISANLFSSGELRPGERSWADLGVSSVHPGEGGVTGREGPHRGRGPKGYRRSDDRLREVICERLTDDPHVDASEIEVQVSSGEVTLTGSVSDKRMKWRAEDLVEACTGGAEVHNRLRVQR
jgi:osmotically-inducible protein OsmY